jgi:ATP-binding cassette subfamily C protein LapB
MTSQNERAGIPHLLDWSNAIAFIANHYRQSFSPGTLHAAAEWATQKTLPEALRHLARHAGLNCQFLSPGDEKMSAAATAGRPAARRASRRARKL